MPDRYPVSEVVQIGVESTIGTAVVPTIQFGGLGVELDTAAEFDEFSPAGQIPGSIVAPRQEWSTGALSGYPTYTEIQYPLSNLLGAATITTPSGATLARQWVWTPSTAEEASYALLSGLMLEFSRTATPSISGDLFARRLDYAATLATTGVTVPTLVPILPAEGDIWLDSTGASLGTTKLLRDFMFSYSIADLLGPIWPINSSFNSFAAHGVQKPTLEAKLTLGNDAVGAAGLMANLRAGSSVFVRYKATSAALIEGATPYSLQIDSALKVADAPSRSDQDGLLATLDWTFRNVYDATWGSWLKVTLINGSAAL
jgi:hypothetical protein